MATAALLSLGITIFLMILSLLFKVSAKLRLSIPLIYFLVAAVSTLFTDWTTKNEKYVLWGLYILIGIVVLSWIYSLIKAIRGKLSQRATEDALADYIIWQRKKAQEQGIDLNTVTFDQNGNMLDRNTGKQIMF